nr:PfkB family carbohydrate kinase [Streptomyces sp. ICC4]
MDVNFRSRLWDAEEAASVLRAWAPSVDVLIASNDELPLCLPADAPADPTARAKQLLALGVGEVVVKLGAAGATAYGEDGASVHAPARPVRAVDTADAGDTGGAGDAFVAGYLSAFLDGAGTEARLDRAVRTGAFAVSSRGDWEGAPTRSEPALLSSPAGTVLR